METYILNYIYSTVKDQSIINYLLQYLLLANVFYYWNN